VSSTPQARSMPQTIKAVLLRKAPQKGRFIDSGTYTIPVVAVLGF
jgi:hypothetical protein